MTHTLIRFIPRSNILYITNFKKSTISLLLTSHHSLNTSRLTFFLSLMMSADEFTDHSLRASLTKLAHFTALCNSFCWSTSFIFSSLLVNISDQRCHFWSTSSIFSTQSLLVKIVTFGQHRHYWSTASLLVNIVNSWSQCLVNNFSLPVNITNRTISN